MTKALKNIKKYRLQWIGLFAITVLGLAHSSSAQTFQIGQTIDLSGSAAEHGKALTDGARLVIDRVNQEGGVRGRTIKIITLDDKGSADAAGANAQKLIESENVIALFNGAEGGPCVAQTLAASKRKVPVIGCAAGAPDLRDPFDPYSFPIRAAHLDEFRKIIEMATTMGRTRFALLHSDSETGRKHLANVRRLLAEKKLDLALALPTNKLFTTNVAVTALKAADVQVLLNHGSYKTVGEIFQASRANHPALEIIAVTSGAQQLVRMLGESGRGIIFTQVVPFPWSGALPIVREYQQAWKQAYPKAEISFSSLEGYINAKVLVAALQRAKGNTSQALVESLETLNDYDVGGLKVRYTAQEHIGSRFVDTVIANRQGGFSN